MFIKPPKQVNTKNAPGRTIYCWYHSDEKNIRTTKI